MKKSHPLRRVVRPAPPPCPESSCCCRSACLRSGVRVGTGRRAPAVGGGSGVAPGRQRAAVVHGGPDGHRRRRGGPSNGLFRSVSPSAAEDHQVRGRPVLPAADAAPRSTPSRPAEPGGRRRGQREHRRGVGCQLHERRIQEVAAVGPRQGQGERQRFLGAAGSTGSAGAGSAGSACPRPGARRTGQDGHRKRRPDPVRGRPGPYHRQRRSPSPRRCRRPRAA